MFFSSGWYEFMFGLVFLLIFGFFIFAIVQGITRWNKNNHSPRLTVEATVVSRRTDVSYHTQNNGVDPAMGVHTTGTTFYYVTFEVASGDRMEFSVSGAEYGMLVEGDWGDLSFQGTRYLGFERR